MSLLATMLDRDLLYSVLTQVVQKAPGLITAMILTRVFTMDEMGGFFFAAAYSFFFSLLVAFGTNLHLVRSVAAEPQRGLDHLGEVLALRIPLTIAALIVMNSVILAFVPKLFLITLLTSLHFLIGDLSFSFGAYLTGLRRFGLRLVLAISGPAFLITAVALAVLLEANLVQVLACYVASSVFMLAISILIVRCGFGRIPVPRSGHVLKRVVLLCWPLLMLDALQVAQFKLDTVMIFAMVSEDAVAQYETASRLLEVSRLAVRPITVVAFPICVILAKRGHWGDVTRLLLRTVAIAAGIGVAFCLAVTVAPDTIMGAIWGPEYRNSGDLLRVLFFTAPLLLVGVVCASLANAIYLERKLIVIMSAATVLNLLLNFWAIPIWGALGAAWTTLATEASIMIGLAIIWYRTLIRRIRQQRALGPEQAHPEA
jgi:PST family polysaccharide transporter